MAKFLGIDLQPGSLVAAFFGAVILAVMMREKNPFRVLFIVFVGIWVAVFFVPFIIPWLPKTGVDDDALHNAAGAIAGIGGMAICNGLLAAVAKIALRSPNGDA